MLFFWFIVIVIAEILIFSAACWLLSMVLGWVVSVCIFMALLLVIVIFINACFQAITGASLWKRLRGNF